MVFVRKSLIALLGVAWLFVSSHLAAQQSTASLEGHWESDIGVQVDIGRDSQGGYYGTFSQPDQNLHGLLLIEASLKGNDVAIVVREDEPFSGTLSADGQSIAGALAAMSMEVPVSFNRTGAAILNLATIATIDPRFTGTWHGSIAGTEINLRVVNHDDGSASVELINLLQGSLRIPAAAAAVEGSRLTVELPAIGGSLAAALSDDGAQIQGTFKLGANESAVTLARL